jgi:hypothetical protein
VPVTVRRGRLRSRTTPHSVVGFASQESRPRSPVRCANELGTRNHRSSRLGNSSRRVTADGQLSIGRWRRSGSRWKRKRGKWGKLGDERRRVDRSPTTESEENETLVLAEEKMSEAEVSLRLAFYLIGHDLVTDQVSVAIDGAQVRTQELIHFPISEFLRTSGCEQCGRGGPWQGWYTWGGREQRIRIHSSPGEGDVVAKLRSGHTLRVESKKGPLLRSKSSQEYPLTREALGQLLTIDSIGEHDILAVAVPKSPKFQELAAKWRGAPLIRRFGIRLLTVGRDNDVEGLDSLPAIKR